MPTAPPPTVDSGGVIHWVLPASPPTTWTLTLLYSDKTFDRADDDVQTVEGHIDFFDAFDANWPGNCQVCLVGADNDGNIIYQPAYLSGQLTKTV